MLIKTPMSGRPGAFWDMFFGAGVETCVDDGLLKLSIRCGLSERTYRRIQETVKSAQSDDNIKAIFFDVDSGGGDAAECAETAAIIRASTKPTVTYVAGYSASAMYWLTSATQKIFAHPTAFLGSIGVINILPKIDFGTVVVASKSPNKFNSGDDPAAVDREKAILDTTFEQFVSELSINRKVPVEKIEAEWGKGGLLTAAQALAVGMIDEIGDREKALTFAKAFTAAAPVSLAAETEIEETEESAESASEENEMKLSWFATRKAKAEMTPEEAKTAEEISPEWLRENKPEVYQAIYDMGKESAGKEAAAAKEEEAQLTALADKANTDEQAVVASLKSGKIKAADFMRQLLEVRKNPSDTELARRAKAGITGDFTKVHTGSSTGAPHEGDTKAQAAAIVKHLQRDRNQKAGK